MNWVGGSRHRLKYLGEKKIQREFFERQKFGLKTARRHKHSPTKRKQNISQDLKEIMTIHNTHLDSLSGIKTSNSRPIKNMDFDKYEQKFSGRRVTEDVQLDSSPIKTPSKIQLMEARAEQNRYKHTKRHLFPVTEEDGEEEESIFEDEKSFGPTFTKRQTLENEPRSSQINEPRSSQIKISSNQYAMDYNSADQTPKFDHFHGYSFDRDIKNIESQSRQADVMSSCSMMQTWKSPDHQQNRKISVNTFQNECTSKPLKSPVNYTSQSWDIDDNHDPRNFKTPSAFCSMFQHCDLTKNNLDNYRNPEKMVLTPLKTPLLSPILSYSGEEPGKMEISDPNDWHHDEDIDLGTSFNKMDCSEMHTVENNIEKEKSVAFAHQESANNSNSSSIYLNLNSTEAGDISTESPLPDTVGNYNDYSDGTGEKLSPSSIKEDDNLDHDTESYVNKNMENKGNPTQKLSLGLVNADNRLDCDIESYVNKDFKYKGNLTPVSLRTGKNLDHDNGSLKVNNICTQTDHDKPGIPCKNVQTQSEDTFTQTSQDIPDTTCKTKEEKFTQTGTDIAVKLQTVEQSVQTSPGISIKIQTVEQSVQTSLDTLDLDRTKQKHCTLSDAATSPFKNLVDQEAHSNQVIFIPED